MKLLGEKIQQLDTPNKNKHIYLTERMKSKLSTLKDGYSIYGKIGMPDAEESRYRSLPLSKQSHLVTNLRIEESWLVGDIIILNSPQGLILQELIKTVKIVFRLASIAHMTEEHRQKRKRGIIVDVIDIFAICAIPEDSAA